MNTAMSIHILFSSGSNPYLHYNLSPVEFANEILKWSENYSLAFDKTYGEGIIQFIATEKGARKHSSDEPF